MPINSIYGLMIILLGLVIITACSPTRALNAVVPSNSYTVQQDVAYLPELAHPRQTMDIYIPEQTPHKQNIVVFLYGGGWDDGDKADFEFIGQAFARLGYVTVIPNYRLFPEVEFPAFIEDAAAAVQAIPNHVPSACNALPTNQRGLILVGHSAGAHSAAMLVADPSYIGNSMPIAAFIGLSGPYDLPLDHERVGEKFSQVQGDEANPVAIIAERKPNNIPPTLLLHGEADTIAKPAHSESFAAELKSLGVPTTFKLYPSRRHVALVASLASPLRFWTPAYEDIQIFLTEQHLDSDCD
ncbi:alpha/beta hydrolase [Aliidiomarina sp.]|uniref:alpha/beta hydrolase n=1 Tax=Aliidiomarina sp. TaxID=1872439 RepID=UPI003A4DE77D